jgi:hypothetical protein
MNMGEYQLNTTTVVHALQWFMPGPDIQWLVYISVILMLIAITGLLIYTGLRLLLKWPPFRWQIIVIFVLVIVAGIVTAVGAVFQYSRATEKAASVAQRQSIVMKKKHIHLASGPNDFHQYFMPLAGDTIRGSMAYALGDINLSVRPVPADSLFITLIQSASAWQEPEAKGYAEKITYRYTMQDTLVTLNPFFMFPQNDGMRYQKLDIIVGIPIKTEVKIDENLRWNIRNGSDFVDWNKDSNKFIMTTAGLKRADPPVVESDSTAESNSQ